MRKHRLPISLRRSTVPGPAILCRAVLCRERPAYRFTVKHSIYAHPDRFRLGVGRALLTALIQACASAGVRRVIGYINGGNVASLWLHEGCGFRQVGYLRAVAFRFGEWTDTVMVRRAIGPEM